MNETESKLLELASMLKVDAKDKVDKSEAPEVDCELIETETSIDDIDDLVSKNFDRVLTNKDYLILVGLDNKSIDVVASEHNVSLNYVKKLMRSGSGSDFLKTQAKQKMQTALDISSLTIARGVEEYHKMVSDMFARGDSALALNFIFGKASLLEAQNMLFKQAQGVEPDDGNAMKSLFSSLLSDAVKK